MFQAQKKFQTADYDLLWTNKKKITQRADDQSFRENASTFFQTQTDTEKKFTLCLLKSFVIVLCWNGENKKTNVKQVC